MKSVERLRYAARAHPTAVDSLLGALVFGISLVPVAPPGGPPPQPVTAGSVLLALTGCGALALRRRHPLPVLGVVSVAAAVSLVTLQTRGFLVLTVGIAAYTVATRTSRRTAVAVGTASALTLGACAVVALDVGWLDPAVVVLLLWFGLAVAAGTSVRTRRDYIAVLTERAQRAEQTREQEARRRVAEERLRIARELHDVVAHHIAVINVQAGVAGHLIREQPAVAEDALGHVRAAARTALEELATLLGVLRRDEESGPDAPTEPAPSLSRLDALIEAFAAGQPVRWTVSGQPRALPSAVDVAAYRILQESLTNACRHASGTPVTVRLTYDEAAVTVEVCDGGPAGAAPAASPGTGLGLLGMRERAESVGGTFSAGRRPEGGFRVHAVLPARATQEEAV
ncbi:signal transduction histidine kinase [Actinoplanes octamycinicus]|uniref:histidine kinase n=1 Tax=Actinoplanes octamycinicus TaxID=135948 RepID=A0A7W7H175_9ACTN|nr:histidine kinase [Actinoplanes octamycinicus]MBB4742091.1 signal transduction histidine kinase [Actinoplanes octamycinicus]